MTLFIADSTKNAVTTDRLTCQQAGIKADVSFVVTTLFTYIAPFNALSDSMLERNAFMAISEESFAEDWDSPEDAIYDNL